MLSMQGLLHNKARAAAIGLLCATPCALVEASLTPALAAETVLFDFKQASGFWPTGSLITDASGALYGTLQQGGTSAAGAVFKLTPPASGTGMWTGTILNTFKGGADGMHPIADLVFDAQGALYGVTHDGGGTLNAGTVFKLAPPASGTGAWTETILHRFGSQSDGANPSGSLIFDTKGSLYGTTAAGGSMSAGTVFKLTPPVSGAGAWKETVIYNFQGQPDGSQPRGNLIFDAKGVLYGTTYSGGSTVTLSNYGTVFMLTPASLGTGPWKETILHSFKGLTNTDGYYPDGGLILDKSGALYGTATGGGSGNVGVAFKLTPPAVPSGQWTEQILFNFNGSGGAVPLGSLLFDPQGRLYGTTKGGGNASGSMGTVYRLTPPASGSGLWTETLLHNFAPCAGQSGCEPTAGLMRDAAGALYGTASQGTPASTGAVFRLVCSQWSGTGANKSCVSW
jgi:uncharacterized repeat protein (TIGR03803 family)